MGDVGRPESGPAMLPMRIESSSAKPGTSLKHARAAAEVAAQEIQDMRASGLFSPKNVCLMFGAGLLFLLAGYGLGRASFGVPTGGLPGAANCAGPTVPGDSAPGAKNSPGPGPGSQAREDMSPRLSRAKDSAQDIIKLLEDYYAPRAYQTLARGMFLGLDKDRKPLHAASFQYVSDRIARALVHKEKFVIGAIGSSVMCGHDNCADDSLPRQLQRELSHVFSSADVGLEIRNAGEGGGCGDSYMNQIYCVLHLVGNDIDMLMYTWTYFEHEEPALYHELILRWLLMMPKAPPLLIFNTGGMFGKGSSEREPGGTGDPGFDVAFGDRGSAKAFEEAYGKYGVNAVLLERGLALNGKYAGKTWGEVGDGVHNTTRYGEGLPKNKRDSLGVVFRNWHPGPLGFQYTSDAISYYVLHAFQHAVDEILGEVGAGRDPLARWPQRIHAVSQAELPQPIYRGKSALFDKLLLSEEPPSCLTYEMPTFGVHLVGEAPASSSLNPYKDKLVSGQKWDDWSEPVNWWVSVLFAFQRAASGRGGGGGGKNQSFIGHDTRKPTGKWFPRKIETAQSALLWIAAVLNWLRVAPMDTTCCACLAWTLEWSWSAPTASRARPRTRL